MHILLYKEAYWYVVDMLIAMAEDNILRRLTRPKTILNFQSMFIIL